MTPHNSRSMFSRGARYVSDLVGSPIAFFAAVFLVLGWAVAGPLFGFSSTWQLFINTCTTILTFLVVFVIQNTQNRDTRAIQIKLDEIIRVSKGAHKSLLDLEELEEDDLKRFQQKFEKLAETARKHGDNGEPNA